MPLGQGALGQFALGQFLTVGAAALIGVAATAFAGQITPSDVLNLTGVAATGAAGTITARDAPTLTGAAAIGAAGTLTPAGAGVLTGAVGTAATGFMAPLVSVSLSGVSGAGAAGTLTPQFGTLPSAVSTGVPGTLAPAVTVSLSGVAASGVAGDISTHSATLVGVSAAGAASSILPTLPYPLLGVAGTGTPGTVSFATPFTLDPAVAFGVSGEVTDTVTVTLQAASVFATAQAGDIIVPRQLVGVSATGVAGVVRPQSGANLTPIGCVVIGRGYEAFIDGRAAYANIVGRDCGCDGMNTHKPEWFQQGDTWQLQGNLHYADGTPFNLNAGCSIAWGLQNAAGQVVFELTLGDGITVLNADGGVCLVTVTPAQSAGIPPAMYTDQLQATDPTGLVSTQWQGSVEVKPAFFA